MRIVSMLPAATEMVFALGLEDRLVGVSHECDFPLAARDRPVVVHNALEYAAMSAGEIDGAVRSQLERGGSLYVVDEQLLESLAPTLILSQELCRVCAPSGNDLVNAVRALREPPGILWFTPHTLHDVADNLITLGAATGRESRAREIVARWHRRLGVVDEHVRQSRDAGAGTRRVFVVEWIDPIYASGHWVPEMVARAGGVDAVARAGEKSVCVTVDDVARWAPEVLIVAPCGFDTAAAAEQAATLIAQPGWRDLAAVRTAQVYAVDANAYFARPGPRLIDGVEMLAYLLHPSGNGTIPPTVRRVYPQ